MKISILKTAGVIIGFIILQYSVMAQQVVEPNPSDPAWIVPYKPFRIAGNLYYVGTADLACYLIVTPAGNILINTGLASSGKMIIESIRSLGFKPSDTKILLTTQAHYDHMGAMADLQKLSGADVMINEADASVAADGGKSDYALGSGISTYKPVKVNRLLHDGDEISLGGTKIIMLHHPGHTKGSSSFIFDVKDENRSFRVLVANLPSIIVSERFSDIPAYPNIEADYELTFASLKSLTFDIWLASHASQFGLAQKHKADKGYNPSAFFDQKGYHKIVADLEAKFIEKKKQKK